MNLQVKKAQMKIMSLPLSSKGPTKWCERDSTKGGAFKNQMEEKMRPDLQIAMNAISPVTLRKIVPTWKKKLKSSLKKKKALYVGWHESKSSDSKNEEKYEANLSITNENICFMADNEHVTLDDYVTSEEI